MATIFATRGVLRRSDNTKIVFAGGAYDAPPDPLVGWGGGYPLPIPYPWLRPWVQVQLIVWKNLSLNTPAPTRQMWGHLRLSNDLTFVGCDVKPYGAKKIINMYVCVKSILYSESLHSCCWKIFKGISFWNGCGYVTTFNVICVI